MRDTIQFPGYKQIVQNEVYEKEGTARDLEGNEMAVTHILRPVVMTIPTGREVGEVIRSGITESPQYHELAIQLADISKEERDHLQLCKPCTEPTIEESGSTYLNVQKGILLTESLQEAKELGLANRFYNAASEAPQWAGDVWGLCIAYDASILPNKDDLLTLIRYETKESAILKVTGHSYQPSEVISITEALYNQQENLNLIKNISTDLLRNEVDIQMQNIVSRQGSFDELLAELAPFITPNTDLLN